MNMEKVPKLSRHIKIKNTVFEFVLAGDLKECVACIKILNVLDLDEQGIKFLCLKEHGLSPNNNAINLAGLIEVEKGATIDGMIRFFRALDAPFWDCISLVSLCEDVNSWLKPCFIKKARPTSITLKRGGVVMKKGTLTVPAPAKPSSITLEKEGVVMKNLPDRKRRRSRWD